MLLLSLLFLSIVRLSVTLHQPPPLSWTGRVLPDLWHFHVLDYKPSEQNILALGIFSSEWDSKSLGMGQCSWPPRGKCRCIPEQSHHLHAQHSSLTTWTTLNSVELKVCYLTWKLRWAPATSFPIAVCAWLSATHCALSPASAHWW